MDTANIFKLNSVEEIMLEIYRNKSLLKNEDVIARLAELSKAERLVKYGDEYVMTDPKHKKGCR